MKVALVHDWLTGMRGGEKVLEVFCELFPRADIFTLVHAPGSLSKTIASHRIRASYLQNIPGIQKKYRHFLPLMPHAMETVSLVGYDLVVSTSHCVAKGCKPGPKAKHVCCCFTPMRYIWDQYSQYFGPQSAWPVRLAMQLVRPYLQRWDVASSARVNEFIAISNFVSERIKRYYERESCVIYPPVDTDFYTPSTAAREDYYLVLSALVPYKRIDLAVDAFNHLQKPLKIVGSGPELKRLQQKAGKNIQFFGWASNEALRTYYQNCKALIFPGIEDFGIVPIEAMACGKPVIAFGQGGATETIAQNKTGIFFPEQTAQSLAAAVEQFEGMVWDASAIRSHAERFGYERYRQELKEFFKRELKMEI